MEQREYSTNRELHGFVSMLWKSILMLIPITGVLFMLSVYRYFGMDFYREQYAGAIFALILAGVFIGVPAGGRAAKHKVPWYDWLLTLAGAAVGMYIFIYYPQILMKFAMIDAGRLTMSVLAFVLILEALRRLLGWTLVIIVGVFFLYAFTAPMMPGPFQGEATSFDQLMNYLYLDTSSFLDLLRLAATMGLAFILFGQVLLQFKGGEIFNNLALTLFGRFRGGAAKASVVGSSLVGSITGGPVANVMLTGNITIPLMKRNGYSKEEAGAIESVASTGGVILPPLMGIVAFLIADNLGVPYQEVAMAAVVPAFLYYLCIFVQVDFRAAKKGLGTISVDLPSKKDVFFKGTLILPIFGILVHFLFIEGRSPEIAAVYSAFAAFLLLLIQKEARQNIPQRLMKALQNTGQMILEIGVILAAAGLIVGIIRTTGLGFNLVQALVQVGQYGLFILLLSSAAVCIVLGMGMPGIAAYSIVAVLVAPSLVELGVTPIAAHLFVFFFAIVSNITPPIALACFAASPIAGANPYKIGMQAISFGVMAYIVPFLFVYDPLLLLSYEWTQPYVDIGLSVILAVIGSVVLSICFVGYAFHPLSMMQRCILAGASVMMFVPIGDMLWNAAAGLVGICIAAAVFLANYKFKSKQKNHYAEGPLETDQSSI
ncbi:TRAP transporter permease [Salibacterium sp. K-3]